ncbi:hypothetical protein [Mesorhizobium sp. M1409]|uniref:hypothetical protein n=1 Tax=unclassified Mesorhizobium TaxID=325217 RepID=UPI00333CC179
MKMALFCAVVLLAGNGPVDAKEKKTVISDAAALCSAKHSVKKDVPELDCSLTGTATAPLNGTEPTKQRLGYDTNPWIVTGF